jgi:phosphate transport system permease protein
MSERDVAVAPATLALPSLRRSAFEPRALKSLLLTTGAWIAAIIAAIPLISVLYMLIVRGGSRLHWEIFTELPPAGFEMGGGFGNALLGTIVMVGIGGLLSIPLGILAAVFLAELGPNSRLAQTARFAAKTLTGLPSILTGSSPTPRSCSSPAPIRLRRAGWPSPS